MIKQLQIEMQNYAEQELKALEKEAIMETTVNNLTEQVVALMQSGNEKAKAELKIIKEKQRLEEEERERKKPKQLGSFLMEAPT
jgi:hypothetical protein